MPKSVKRFSDDIMLYPFDLEADSDFRSIRPESSGSSAWQGYCWMVTLLRLNSVPVGVGTKPAMFFCWAV